MDIKVNSFTTNVTAMWVSIIHKLQSLQQLLLFSMT